MPAFKLKFAYRHGPADDHRLDLYDGAISLEGLSRALAITTHAFVNGEIRTHGDAARGAKFYLLPSKRGSFEHSVLIWMADACTAGVFYDFLGNCFREAVGIVDPESGSNALQKRLEPTIGELPAVLEAPLVEVHRPIREHPEMTLTMARPRGEALVIFNEDTLRALQPSNRELREPVVGNVTRYNTLSRWGKFYDRRLGRVTSFVLGHEIDDYQRSLVTWSLHESNLRREGTLHLYVTATITPSGHVKRYHVHRLTQQPSPA